MPAIARLSLSVFLSLFIYTASAQVLKPGFAIEEYQDVLSIGARFYDSMAANSPIPKPVHYRQVFLSPEIGFKNRWSMWYRDDGKLAVMSIRGTIGNMISWLANFYSAMVPASGSLQINDSTTFNYQLAADPKAAVHVGWLVGVAAMSPTMLEQIRMAYAAGIRSIIVSGHSQGGSLAVLTTSYLLYLQQKGDLPKDIIFKSYCSASPKPGNLYYAYDFDFITRNGYAFTIVNAADWVPETPFSLQTLSDFNPLNPFVHAKSILKKQKFLVRLVLGSKYNKANRKTRRSQAYFEKVFGHNMYSIIHKTYPQFREPVYVHTDNYQRAGVPIVLQPDSAYYLTYPNDFKNIFQHHLLDPYYELSTKYYGKSGN